MALVVDAHNDSIVAHIRRGHLGFDGEPLPSERRRHDAVGYLRQYITPLGEGIQLDIPQMRAGSIDAAFFAVDTTRAWGNHLLYGLDALGYFTQEVADHAKDLVIARSTQDIQDAKNAGKLAAVLAIENSNVLEQSLNILPLLYQLGVRTITLTHSARTWAGDGCEVEGNGGLTGFGKALVRRMNELGMLVDISHLNQAGFWDTLACSQAPVVATHSCCHALCDHPRNLTDEQIKALSANGGVICLTFVPSFIDTDNPTMTGLLDHIDHAVQTAGIDHVGLGSDFDGGGDLLKNAGEYPSITAGLMDRNWAPDAIRKILGGNLLRLLRQTIG
jgi:membrane dipeptidase